MSFNQCMLLGNLGGDPVLKVLNQEQQVVNFSLATSENYLDKQGIKTTVTQWHRVIAWNHLAQTAVDFLRKGSQCLICGQIKYRSYENDAKQTLYITEIYANSIQLTGVKPTTPPAPLAHDPKNDHDQF